VIFRTLRNPAFATMPPEDADRERKLADVTLMQTIHNRIDSIVKDPETAGHLKPHYLYYCKRPGFHDEYLEAFNRPNVSLVDTDGRSIERATEHGLVVDGHEYGLDCLIFATGFNVDTPYTERVGFDIAGRDGLLLSQKWADGFATFQGIMSRGFPNLFFMPVRHQQSAVTVNIVDAIYQNAEHIAHIIGELARPQLMLVEVSSHAEREWIDFIVANSDSTELSECTPSWLNNHGRPDLLPRGNTHWGKNPLDYFVLLEKWRAAGDFAGLEISPITTAVSRAG
jgi:cation diffusion facilitator CzcD-associated flavoprotein CzcO